MARAFAVLTGVGILMLGAGTTAAIAASRWTTDGNATWVKGAGDDGGANYGLVTVSAGNGTYDCSFEGNDCYGQALLSGRSLPTTDPTKINALSYDFNPAQGGASGGSPRMVICFSDTADPTTCDSNAELGPVQWTRPDAWTHVNGFAASDGVNNVWFNAGGSCPNGEKPSWKAIVACHPGVKIVQVRVVNDSGWEFPNGDETITLDNLRVNGVIATGP
jgi:hypothetical protein